MRYRRGRAGRLVAPKIPDADHEYELVTCVFLDCEYEDGKIYKPGLDAIEDQDFVRFRLGMVSPTPTGLRFSAEFKIDNHDFEAFVHRQCAEAAGISLEDLRDDVCCLCREPVDQEGAVYLVELGWFDNRGKFTDERGFAPDRPDRGIAHWACADEEWSDGLTLAIDGEWFLTELEEALHLRPQMEQGRKQSWVRK